MKSLAILLAVMVAVLFTFAVTVKAQDATAEKKAAEKGMVETKDAAPAAEAAKPVPTDPKEAAALAAERKEAKADEKEKDSGTAPAAAADAGKPIPMSPKDAAAAEAELKAAKADRPESEKEKEQKDIADTIMANPNYKELVEGLKTAGLVDTLKGKGPLTLLGANDNAFAKLTEKEKEALKDKAVLAATLKCHVVEGKLTKDDIAKMKELKTLGGMVAVEAKDGLVKVGGATLAGEVAATNGVIISVDQVIVKK